MREKPFTAPSSPDLPTDRVYEGLPFTYTGIDLAGPLHLNSASPENRSKAYCCLFTCASTRALHLELTESLAVTSFLQAFPRFVSRRGLPAKLLTHNAKTFKSVSVDVKKISMAFHFRQNSMFHFTFYFAQSILHFVSVSYTHLTLPTKIV